MNERKLRRSLAESCEGAIRFRKEGRDRFRVLTPFQYSDGDHLVIVLKRDGDRWCLSDEAHSFMSLSYRMNLNTLDGGPRREFLDRTKRRFDILEWDGALVKLIDLETFSVELLEFAQALVQISDIDYLRRDRVQSTFRSDLKRFIVNTAGDDHVDVNWHDAEHDVDGRYPADYRIHNGGRPLFLFALTTDNTTRDATISLLKYDSWGLDFVAGGIFEERQKVTDKAISRFTDSADFEADFQSPIEMQVAKQQVEEHARAS